jgi:hypothetical protein
MSMVLPNYSYSQDYIRYIPDEEKLRTTSHASGQLFNTGLAKGGPIQGGEFWRITPLINWYLSKDVPLTLAYRCDDFDRSNMKRTTQIFQTRLQLTIFQNKKAPFVESDFK